MGLAWTLYVNDNEETACPSYFYTPDYLIETAWDFRIDWTDGNKPVATLGLFGPYTRSGQISSCPSFRPDETWGRPYTGYAYNATYIGGDILANLPVAGFGQISDPSGTALIADAGYGNQVKPQNYLRAPSDPFFGIGKVHFRHSATASVVFCDGHAKATNHLFLPSQSEPNLGALSQDDSAYDLQ